MQRKPPGVQAAWPVKKVLLHGFHPCTPPKGHVPWEFLTPQAPLSRRLRKWVLPLKQWFEGETRQAPPFIVKLSRRDLKFKTAALLRSARYPLRGGRRKRIDRMAFRHAAS